MEAVPRRRFLALAAAASVALCLPASAAEPFEAADAEVMRALLRIIYGPGSERLDVVAGIERSLDCVDADRQPLIRSLPSLFDQASRALVPTFVAWHALPEDDQRAALDDWASSSLVFRRTVHNALRQLLLLHAYMDEATWAEIAYPGPWLGRLNLPVHPPRFGDLS